MKKILTLILLCLSLTAMGASKDPATRKVLDATAAHLTSAGGMSIKFTATSFLSNKQQGMTSGTMNIKGKKFQMTSSDMLTWFDGKTQWSMQPGDGEVSMTEPTAAELQAMNPYAFISLYKSGFNYKMSKTTLSNGAKGYKIYMTADNGKQKIREIYLEIDNSYNPVRVSVREGKSQWVRIDIKSFQTGKNFKDSDFTFPSKDYPRAEVIDLR